MDNIVEDQPTTSFSTGYVRLRPGEDNQTNRNYLIVTYKQILIALLCVLIVIVLLLVVIIVILLKTSTQTPHILYNTTTTKFTSKLQKDLFIDNVHDNLYVVDTKNNRIQKYSLTESFDPHQGAIGITVASNGVNLL
ncbi:hypothetical protein I4U23_016210 [Adineta vaga]|nr:hypothetical protein I4U23_016210 [Adineta vaga]